jgi:hypothetical protein
MSNANFINGFAIAAIASEGEPDFACLSVIYKRMIFIKCQAIMLLPKQELPRFQMVKGTLMEQVKWFAIAAIASEGEPDFACLSVIYKTYSGLSAGTISTTGNNESSF